MNTNKQIGLLSLPVFVAALGYFVDVYDLLLFTIVRQTSVMSIGSTAETIIVDSAHIINWQMSGLLIGGILWGVLGDKKGRLKVLFGSILLYSVANILTSFVQNVDQYAYCRFIGGIGLAGELGAGITLVSEMLPKHKRGIGTSMVAGIGLFGAVFAYFTFKYTNDWRLCYQIGGVLGFFLLILRVKVAESFMFESVKLSKLAKGNFFMFFQNKKRFVKYITAILIGLPTWFVIGVLINYSNKFASSLYEINLIDSGRSIMLAYVGIATGDLLIGYVSQYFKSRKKALLLFYILNIIGMILFFSPFNNNDGRMYLICAFLGFSTGYWAIFNQMAAEQFGTNLRATAATTIPNMVRGALPLINFLFLDILQKKLGWDIVQSGMFTGAIVMVITLVAYFFTEETYHKDLDYMEHDNPLP
ncbi:MAG: MFS transporter [Sediminibacterium sp.]|jgi:MFS transporter, putative metabolite:H+ symporter|nr:MFS transporter [Sediminibacterium sp.]